VKLDDRIAGARTDLDELFAGTEVPPASGVRSAHRRRRVARFGAGALAIVALALGTAAVVTRDDADEPVILTPPDSEPPEPTAPAPTTVDTTAPTSAAAVTPLRMVGATNDGRIVELASDGSIGREIVRAPAGASVLEVALYGDTVWYVAAAATSSDCGTLFRVPLAGGEPDAVVDLTNQFALNANGTRLAYGVPAYCKGDGTTESELVIDDLETGERHQWVTPSESQDFFEVHSSVGDVTWSPDGDQLAAAWCYEGCSTLLHDPNVDGTFSYQGAVGGEHPAFVGSTLWSTESFYPDPPAVLTLERFDLASGTHGTQPSPFAAEIIFQLDAGPDGSLVAVSGGFEGDPLVVERWDLAGEPPVKLTLDTSVQAVAIG